ncbi:stressosome-associated protein Prli42 [Bacillus andreraoultii]|nr:stressosome-associated protein Prli42 [Bacillus andreraoultii]
MGNKKVRKIIVYLMILAMVATTLFTGLSALF